MGKKFKSCCENAPATISAQDARKNTETSYFLKNLFYREIKEASKENRHFVRFGNMEEYDEKALNSIVESLRELGFTVFVNEEYDDILQTVQTVANKHIWMEVSW